MRFSVRPRGNSTLGSQPIILSSLCSPTMCSWYVAVLKEMFCRKRHFGGIHCPGVSRCLHCMVEREREKDTVQYSRVSQTKKNRLRLQHPSSPQEHTQCVILMGLKSTLMQKEMSTPCMVGSLLPQRLHTSRAAHQSDPWRPVTGP